MIEDRQPRRGFRDNATEYEQFEDDGTDRPWPTAGHRPPGYDEHAGSAYAYEQSGPPADSGYPEDESSGRRAAHADGDRDDADELEYGPPSDRYSVLAELAYDPREQNRNAPPAAAREDEDEQHPYAGQRREEPQPYGGPRREEQEPQPYGGPRREEQEPQPYGRQRYEEQEPHPYAEQAYQDGFQEPRDERFQPPSGPPAAVSFDRPADDDDAHAAYRRGSGEDNSATAIYPGSQYEPADQGGGVPWGPPPLPGGPVPMPLDDGPEIGQPTDVIDLTAPRVLPRTHRGEQRKRALILVVAAVGVLLAGGVGYAIFGTGSSSDPIPAGAAPAEEASAEDPVFPDESDPGTDTAETTPSRTAGTPSSVAPTTPRSTGQAPSNPRTTTTTRPAGGGSTHKPTLPTPHPPTKKPTPPPSKPPTHQPTPPPTPSSTPPTSADPSESTSTG